MVDFYFGIDNSDGQTAKVANQIIVALNIEAVAKALLFTARASTDSAQVRHALMGSFTSNKTLEVHGEGMGSLRDGACFRKIR